MMDTLIADLERATEGSEELDVAICKALCNYGPDDPLWHVMPYTRSLDVALTLVPQGCCWEVSGDPDWEAKLLPSAVVSPIGDDQQRRKYATTPALALCIAALRARQAMKDTA